MPLKTILSLFAVVALLAGCETASEGSGSASGGGQQTAAAGFGRYLERSGLLRVRQIGSQAAVAQDDRIMGDMDEEQPVLDRGS